ncbi:MULTISPECIES: Rv1733c family protein [unclassified Geodermatophilus]
MTEERDTLARRSLRRFTLGSGPLKRGSDRIQVAGRIVVVLSFLLAPLLAVVVSTATAAHLSAVAAAEAAERSRTQAVLLEEAPGPVRRGDGTGGDGTGGSTLATTVPVRATWPAPGGASRVGPVPVPPGTPAGTAVPVWVDREGDLAAAPRDRSGIPTSAATAGAVPLVGVPLVAWTLHVLLGHVLDVRRERAWEREWATVGPDWHSRLL